MYSVHIFGKLAAFKHGRRNLSLFAKRTFYLSIIQSALDYASNSYVHSLGSRPFNRLVTVSHIAMKKVFGLDRMTPTVVVLRHYNLYSFEQRINLKSYVFVYRCLFYLSSPFLTPLFVSRADGRHTHARTRGQAHNSLVLPNVHLAYGFRSISFLAADRWNALPSDCRQAASPSLFAHNIKSHLGYPVISRSVGTPLVK